MHTSVLAAALAAGLAVAAPITYAAELSDDRRPESAGVLELAFAGSVDGIARVSEDDLDALRGGAGIRFSGSFFGEYSGPLITDVPDGFTVDVASPGSVLVSSAFGSFNDFRGIVQVANVVGDLNTINNVLNLNVTIERAGAGAAVMPISLTR
jgi:hypothetical protein